MKSKTLYKFLISLMVVFAIGCNKSIDDSTKSNGQISDKQLETQISDKLPKTISLIIGRGNICCGHFISIEKNGEYEYFIGDIESLTDRYVTGKDKPLEVLDAELLTHNKYYDQKNGKIPLDKIKQITQLINDEKKLIMQNQVRSSDAHIYQLYLDKKLITFGDSSQLDSSPDSITKLINLITSEVGLHELPPLG